jgi:hypothetical protein
MKAKQALRKEDWSDSDSGIFAGTGHRCISKNNGLGRMAGKVFNSANG